MRNILTKALLSTALFSTLIIASDMESDGSSTLSTRTTPHVVEKGQGKAQKLRSLIYAAGADFDEYDGVVPAPESLLAEKLKNLSIGEDCDDEFSGARCRPMAGKKDLVQGLKRKFPTATTRVQTAYETQLITKIKATSKNVTVYTPDTLPKTAKEVTNGAYIVLNLSDILISGVGAIKYGFKLHLKDIIESRTDIHIVVLCDVDSETLCLNSFTKTNNRPTFVQHLPQMVEHVELHDPEGKITTLSSGLLAGHPKLQTVVFKGFQNLRHIEAKVGINSPSVSKIDLSNLVNLETVGDGFFAGHDAAVVDLEALKKLTSVGSHFLKPKQLRDARKVLANGKKQMIPTQRQAVTGYDHLNDDVQMALYHSYQIPEVRRKLAEKQYDEEGGCGCCGLF